MLIRAATLSDAAGLAKVHVDTWRATYRGMVADSFLDGLSHERSANGWERALGVSGSSQRVLVAEDDQGSVVGFASGGPNRDSDTPFGAELWAVYVLPDQQERGLGKCLLREFATVVEVDGFSSLGVWVLAANAPARRFYEAMQGLPAGQRQVEVGGQSLDEVAYGWPDIRILVAPSITPGRRSRI